MAVATPLLLVLALAATASLAGAARVATTGEREIRLLMVRHGLSCANIISEYGGIKKLVQHKNYPDPLLSNCGVQMTRQAAKLLEKEQVDFVGASYLTRAIETAWLQFGGRQVHVLPHVAEEATGLKGVAVSISDMLGIIDDADNKPLPQEEQEEILRRHYHNIAINYDYINASQPSSWTAFEGFLAARLLPKLLTADQEGVYTLGVASHSLFLEASLGKAPGGVIFKSSARESLCYEAMPVKGSGRTKPYNNQILEIFYKYDTETKRLQLDVSKGCRAIGASPSLPVGVPGRPKQVCEADFARCIAGWPGSKACQAGPRTWERFEPHRGKTVTSPGLCATHHECNEGFPYIHTPEQSWAEKYRATVNTFCNTAGGSCSSMAELGCEPCSLPPLPDLAKECQCVAPDPEAQCPAR